MQENSENQNLGEDRLTISLELSILRLSLKILQQRLACACFAAVHLSLFKQIRRVSATSIIVKLLLSNDYNNDHFITITKL